MYFGIVLGVAGVQGNRLEVKTHAEVGRRYNVLLSVSMQALRSQREGQHT